MRPSCKKCPKIKNLGHLFDSEGHLFEMEGHLFEMEGHLFNWEGHLFDRKGHLFGKGSQFCKKILEGRNFDHVYEPLACFFRWT